MICLPSPVLYSNTPFRFQSFYEIVRISRRLHSCLSPSCLTRTAHISHGITLGSGPVRKQHKTLVIMCAMLTSNIFSCFMRCNFERNDQRSTCPMYKFIFILQGAPQRNLQCSSLHKVWMQHGQARPK